MSIISSMVLLYVLGFKTSQTGQIWIDLGSTPSAKHQFTPQGLTYIDGYLYLAESHDDKIGVVYQIDPNNGAKITGQFQLPDDAVHTSGLAWDDQYLWAVDYASRKLYQIDLKASISTGQASIINVYQTGLKGPSAITIFVWKNTHYLALSDFRNSKQTYIIPHGNYAPDKPIAAQALYSYENKTFSQGLTSDGTYLYEAINKIGTDVIYKLDLCELFKSHDFDTALVDTIHAPDDMVEDLAISDDKLWTSDESSYSIYVTSVGQKIIPTSCQ